MTPSPEGVEEEDHTSDQQKAAAEHFEVDFF